MSSLIEIMQALASQIDTQLNGTTIPNLQVEAGMMWAPTPPCIDIYPADPLEQSIGFGKGNKDFHLIVRARVDTPDREGAQELLLSMMDTQSPTSVELAILEDETLGGKVEDVAVESGPSGFGYFTEPDLTALLGCTWTVVVTP